MWFIGVEVVVHPLLKKKNIGSAPEHYTIVLLKLELGPLDLETSANHKATAPPLRC